MTLEEMAEMINQIYRGQVYIEKAQKDLKVFEKQHRENVNLLCTHMTEEMIPEMVLGSLEVKAGFETKYDIVGGRTDNPNRTKVINTLVDLGFLDETKVSTIREVNGNALSGAVRKLAKGLPDKLAEMLSLKQISTFQFAKVKVKKVED